MTLRIKLVSDLHLEWSDINIVNDNNYDVLVLAGDITTAAELHDHPALANTGDQMAIASGNGLSYRQQSAQRYRDFFKRVSFQFPHVVYVAGNHEFYGGKWVGSIQTLRNETAVYPNIHFLENDTVTINDVVFVGGTLWTDMNKFDALTMHAVRDMMNDFKLIRDDSLGYSSLKPATTVHRHRKTLQYIKMVLDTAKDKKVVVVGHHLPSFSSVHAEFVNDYLMNGAYASDLSEFILDHPQIALWCCGHTHHPHQYYIGTTLIACNPRGYSKHADVDEGKGFDPHILLEV